MEAIVLAGGLGTRLREVVPDIPKPMAPVAGKPFLCYLLEWLELNEITSVVLSVGHKQEIISNVFGNRFNRMELIYSQEDSPLGTGGAIALAMTKLTGDRFFIINGDTLFRTGLDRLEAFHREGGYELSIFLKPMKNIDRYGTVTIDKQNRIIAFHEKQQKTEGLINGGIYLANRGIESYFPAMPVFSFEKDFLEKKLHQLSFGGLPDDNYFIDIGVPDDYRQAQTDLANM